MLFRFYFQVIASVICAAGIFFFGEKGYSLFALFALLPVLMRIKKVPELDEREQQLFYKIGNLTLGLSILFVVAIYYLSGFELNGIKIGDFWMPLTVLSIIFTQGLAGIIVFKTQ